MKHISKLFVNLLAVAMVFVACFSLVGCSKSDIVKLELQLAIFNTEENKYYDEEDTKLTIELYRHFAEETVDAIISYAEEGYYDGAIFYGLEGNKIMMGDFKMNESNDIVKLDPKPTLVPEFEYGKVKGSDLTVKEGSVGLWRTWINGYGYQTNSLYDSGRATWFMPTAEISNYNGYFCVFAVIDMENEANATTWGYLKEAIENSETYEVYYTGSYDATSDAVDGGLDFNCEEAIPSGVEPFEPTTNKDPACYKSYQIKVPTGLNNDCGAKIVSAKKI